MTNLRYRAARNRADQLGQVFTPPPIARLLVDSIPTAKARIRHILDLGAGKGALSIAARRLHPAAQVTSAEIDRRAAASLRAKGGPKDIVLCGDALHSQALPAADWIISNPPYGSMPIPKGVSQILRQMGMTMPENAGWIRGDAAFSALAWSLLKIDCGLGLIVSAPLIRNRDYAGLRTRWVTELRQLTVTRLPATVFSGAEVSAFLLTGQRGLKRSRTVTLRSADLNGNILDEMRVRDEAAIANLDIAHHRACESLGINPSAPTLGSIGATIVRGSRSQQQYLQLGLRAFHTSDLSAHPQDVKFGKKNQPYQTAGAGDILIARVGSRCLARQARVAEGRGLFTDCVFRLTAPAEHRALVWRTLTSSFGAEWRIAHAAGSCARHLTVQTLNTMPLLEL